MERVTSSRHPDARFFVRSGDPFTVLTDIAQEVRADVAVVGSSMSIGHRVVGALAVRLMRSRRWPVIVVP
jgi:nucleotide-binding universal stress UspA family protein